MDAREIFKQLTCGAIFKKEVYSTDFFWYQIQNSLECRFCFSTGEETSKNRSKNRNKNRRWRIECHRGQWKCKTKTKRVDCREAEDVTHWEGIGFSKTGSTARICCLLRFPIDETCDFPFQVNHLRNLHHINVHGSSPPDPIETFDELVNACSIPQQIVSNLVVCGYNEPTPIQMQAIPIMAAVI